MVVHAVGNSLETVGYVGYVTENFLRLRRAGFMVFHI